MLITLPLLEHTIAPNEHLFRYPANTEHILYDICAMLGGRRTNMLYTFVCVCWVNYVNVPTIHDVKTCKQIQALWLCSAEHLLRWHSHLQAVIGQNLMLAGSTALTLVIPSPYVDTIRFITKFKTNTCILN